jgi:hypothetical protein
MPLSFLLVDTVFVKGVVLKWLEEKEQGSLIVPHVAIV